MSSRYVVDVNVLISAALSRTSTPRQVVERAFETGAIYFTREIVAEFTSVIRREKFDAYSSRAVRLEFAAQVIRRSTTISHDVRIRACRDPDDNKFLELAVAAEADCIVTGDDDLLVLHPFRGIPILTPDAFVSRV